MAEILDRFCDAEFHADWERARSRLGDDLTPADLERTAAQRRMDALHAIFMAAAAAAPGSKPPEPSVTIVVDQTTFESALTAMAAGVPLDKVMPPVTDPTRRRCETLDGTLVDPCDAVIAAVVGHVREGVVFDSASCTINLGTASRLFRGTSHASPCGSRAPDVCGPDAGATTVRSTTTGRGATTDEPCRPTADQPAPTTTAGRLAATTPIATPAATGTSTGPDGSEITPI